MMLVRQCAQITAAIIFLGVGGCSGSDADESSTSNASGASDAKAGSGARGGSGATGPSKNTGGSSAIATAKNTKVSADCDRACLMGVLQRYLDAVLAHDPAQLPLSADLKMTDDGFETTPRDGVWHTSTMLVPDERLDFADPVTHNVATQCVINEGTSPAMYQARLKVEGGEITEIETMTVRQNNAANGFFDPSAIKPQPIFLKTPDDSERMSRDELMALQEQYLDYLEGKRSGSEVPFDENCQRFENGFSTASGLASFQFQSWSFQVTRRVLIVDEEQQITWGMFPFQQTDNALVVGEAFKMLGGKLMMIQAIMANMRAKAWD